MSLAFPSLREHPPRHMAAAVAVIVVLLVWSLELLISSRQSHALSSSRAFSRIIPDDGSMAARQAEFRARIAEVTIAVNPVWTESGVDVAAASRIARLLARERIGRATGVTTALLAGAATANRHATGELRRQLRDRPVGADYVLIVDYTAARPEHSVEYMLVDAAGEIVVANRFSLPNGSSAVRQDSAANCDEIVVGRIVEWITHDSRAPRVDAPHRPSASAGRPTPTPLPL